MLHKRKQEKPRQFSLQESRYGNISKLYKLSKLDDLLLNPKALSLMVDLKDLGVNCYGNVSEVRTVCDRDHPC